MKRIIHSNNDLQAGSYYLRYHIKMYNDTLMYLQCKPFVIAWDIKTNAFIDSHMIQARILIDFVSKSRFVKKDNVRENDVIAEDFFHDCDINPFPEINDFLKDIGKKVGSHIVHISTNQESIHKSDVDWPVITIRDILLPALEKFTIMVPGNRLTSNFREDCNLYFSEMKKIKIAGGVSPST